MKINMILIVVVCTVLVASTVVRGEEPIDKRWYISPGVNYIFADSDRLSDDDPEFRIGIGKAVSRSWNLELNIMIDNLSGKGANDDYEQRGLSLNALYFLTPESQISPYGVLGIGALRTSHSGEKSTNLMAEPGIGLRLSIRESWALRLEARHRYDDDSSSLSTEDQFNDWLTGLTLTLPLGKMAEREKPQKTAAHVPKDDDGDGVRNEIDRCPGTPAGVGVDPTGCPIDSDKDGVADYMDKCPDTPAGLKVDSNGCSEDSDNDGVADSMDQCPKTPVGIKVDTKGCPIDSDKDGVADYMDKCPGTPAGEKVDADGCSEDSDNDGVADSQDLCPNTPPVAKVDARGCPLDTDSDGVADYIDKCPDTKPDTVVDDKGCALPEKVSITLNIEFETAKADIHSKYHDEIKNLADVMSKYKTTTVEIGGHTDNVGREATNIELSQRRADAVKNYLVEEFGISASRISAKGYGSSKPVADNSTATGRQQNRRVEAVIDTVVHRQ
ncbi:MAG: OmpA family protein [Nitrospirae bacterium]|nr:OmpA family protein [Nitrospirota bacterium]